MASADPNPPLSEDFDPDQTLFFKRRNRHPNLLPLAAVGIVVLASGALVTWAMTRPGKKANAEAVAHHAKTDAFAGQPLISATEAKSLENPPIGPAKELAGSTETVAAAMPGRTPAPPPAGSAAQRPPSGGPAASPR